MSDVDLNVDPDVVAEYKSKVYNALANVEFELHTKTKNTDISKNLMEKSFEWFMEHFYND